VPGVGIITAPPSVVNEYLFEQKVRGPSSESDLPHILITWGIPKDWVRWDCFAKECREVERMDSCTKVMHFRYAPAPQTTETVRGLDLTNSLSYQAERCFMNHRRDFCALLHLIRRSDGSYLLVSFSFLPPLECLTRSGLPFPSLVRAWNTLSAPRSRDGLVRFPTSQALWLNLGR